jgi:hypothetical protein
MINYISTKADKFALSMYNLVGQKVMEDNYEIIEVLGGSFSLELIKDKIYLFSDTNIFL